MGRMDVMCNTPLAYVEAVTDAKVIALDIDVLIAQAEGQRPASPNRAE